MTNHNEFPDVSIEKRDDSRNGGCFDGSSQLMTRSNGLIPMSQLVVGDEILSIDSNGNQIFSPVILFLDRDPDAKRVFVKISTDSGRIIHLTPSHLIYVMDYDDGDIRFNSRRAVFGRQVIPGQFLVISPSDGSGKTNGTITVEKVISVESVERTGVYAPLTSEGNLVVNQVLASCYASISDQSLAHFSFLPIRMYHNFKESIKHVLIGYPKSSSPDKTKRRKRDLKTQTQGIHWYPRFLQSAAKIILPSEFGD